ncbi:hypothetical protein ACQY1Q_11305 [Tenacibaculum sp. TC6]|uniref:hypothetical protein n=1 Tax=Tenacibaculum sp. TC6 TaxID=3423223 RepID=UPI003D360936
MYIQKKEEASSSKAAANTFKEPKTNVFQLVDNRKGLASQKIIQRMDSDEEYEPESDAEMFDADEIYRNPSKSYRGSRSFFTGKDQDTRKNLVKRQTGTDGKLYSGFKGDGPEIKLDKQGREIRDHSKKSTKNKQPDIDHIIDFLAIDDEVDRYDDSDLSEDETEEFKNYLYNVEDNLEILSKSQHKRKKKYTRDTLTKKIKKQARDFVKTQRQKFKTDAKSQKRLKSRHKRSKKKLVNKNP